uniref:Large ribosomal subunit protein mL49 n=1 Tax=Dicentrarchus labrax TaxID=13489 RepID=A0A8P4K0P5_DICLA
MFYVNLSIFSFILFTCLHIYLYVYLNRTKNPNATGSSCLFPGRFSLHQCTTWRPASPFSPLCSAGHCQEFSVSTAGYRDLLPPLSGCGFFVRLIPPSRVPAPPKHAGVTPSGWTPPADSPPPLPYMIRRSRMHNIPVYTDLTNGSRKTTLVRKVEGDIWALEKDVKQYLEKLTGKELPTQVNEVTMTLRVKGHFDLELKEWLASKGF